LRPAPDGHRGAGLRHAPENKGYHHHPKLWSRSRRRSAMRTIAFCPRNRSSRNQSQATRARFQHWSCATETQSANTRPSTGGASRSIAHCDHIADLARLAVRIGYQQPSVCRQQGCRRPTHHVRLCVPGDGRADASADLLCAPHCPVMSVWHVNPSGSS
jgi:hypothetical protein